jgi:hypothetical protein
MAGGGGVRDHHHYQPQPHHQQQQPRVNLLDSPEAYEALDLVLSQVKQFSQFANLGNSGSTTYRSATSPFTMRIFFVSMTCIINLSGR